MWVRTGLILTVMATLAGCSGVRSDLIRTQHLQLQEQNADKVRAIWISAQETDSGMEVTGALRRNDHTGERIRAHTDITVRTPDGRVLAQERSPDLDIPCNRIGAGSQRFKRFSVPVNITPPANGVLQIEVHTQDHL